MITAEAHSDNRSVEITFDATPYLESFSPEELPVEAQSLLDGDPTALDSLVYGSYEQEDVSFLLKFCSHAMDRARATGADEWEGFESSIVDEEALRAFVRSRA